MIFGGCSGGFFGDFWEDFWLIFGRIWGGFLGGCLRIFGRFWVGFGEGYWMWAELLKKKSENGPSGQKKEKFPGPPGANVWFLGEENQKKKVGF